MPDRVMRTHTIALAGLEGVPVRVEAHLSPGMVGMTIVGYGDASLREAKERLRSAMLNCGLDALNRRLTINLSPADLPKAGASFDLAMVAVTLAARGHLNPAALDGTVFVGEVGLDGAIRPVAALMALTLAACAHGFQRVVVPASARSSANLVEGISVYAITHLRELIEAFPPAEDSADSGGWRAFDKSVGTTSQALRTYDSDLAQVLGQPQARQALIVAAAGGHHLLLEGPPGGGKSMLAERLHTLLPELTTSQALTLAAIRSIAGHETRTLDKAPPLEVATPSTSSAALVGGGARIARPGAVSLAHQGVLLLDEAPEFNPRTLDALRGPLERGEVTTRRASATVTYPAQFQLVLTANPCPCGKDATTDTCVCSPMSKRRYQQRLSGPLRDRIDICEHVLAPHVANIAADSPISSAVARERVIEARARSARRWGSSILNAAVSGDQLRGHGHINDGFLETLNLAVSRGWVTMRGANKILRLAWSIADLEGHNEPTADDLSLSMQMRTNMTGNNANDRN